MHFRRHGLTEIDTLYPDVLEFLLLHDGLIPSFPHGFCPPDAAQQTPLLACPHRPAGSQFLDLCHLLHCLSHPECCFGYFVLGCLDVGHFQQPLGFVDLVLHQIQLCTSLHRSAGMMLLLVGHQFPLDRLAGSGGLALVIDDGPAQLTRISLSCAILLHA